jgi:hypothetical protein
MDLVMERAARMGTATPDEMRREEDLKAGMQLTAAYLNGKQASLTTLLAEQNEARREPVRKGMLESLLRNVFLPRDEDGTKRIGLALQGVVDLNPDSGDIAALCEEVRTIASQYGQHRTQLYDQLKEQMRVQIEQLLARKGMKADTSRIDPTMEPQFKDEWARLEADLDRQYGQALEQFKTQLRTWNGA